VQRTLRWWSEMRWVVAWLARHGRFPARDLMRAVTADVDDNDLVVQLETAQVYEVLVQA